MTETQKPFLSDEEHEKQLTFEANLLTNMEIFGYFAKAYLEDKDALGSFLDWSWERSLINLKGTHAGCLHVPA